MSKGSIRRPGQNYGDGWDRIFTTEVIVNKDKQKVAFEKIQDLRQKRIDLAIKIDDVCKWAIKEWHHMSHQVSDFWPCDKSPVGMCVWDISEKGFHVDVECRYCGDPVERK